MVPGNTVIATSIYSPGAVDNLGNGVNLQGGGSPAPLDFGVRFNKPGDGSQTTVTFDLTGAGLSLADVIDTVPSSLPDPERLAVSADCRRAVSAAMRAMSPLERVTFALRHFEGRSISEIAQTVGIGNNAAKQHIFRAVRKLRLALDAHWSGQ